MEDNFEDIDAKPKKKLKLMAILGGVAPIALIIATILYITFFQKDMVNDFLKKYDFIGVSQPGRAEQSRQYQINNLNIPFEQRQALKQGTVFLGATTEMVQLALGNPAQKPEKDSSGKEKWIYFFNENSRPTYLFFEKGKLVNAQKGTTLDNAEIQ